MSLPAPRYPEKFTAAGGLPEVMLPIDDGEWETDQNLRTAIVTVVGADYGFDQLGGQPAPLEPASEQFRATLYGDDPADLDRRVDALRANCQAIGKGKLWTIGADDTRRWAWARLTAMPKLTLGVENVIHQPVSFAFTRLSDWQAEAITVVSQTITAPSASFALQPAGSSTVRSAVFTLKAKKASGFNAPELDNGVTGESWQSTRVAQSANSVLEVDCGRMSVRYSNDGGVTWTDDYPNFSTGPTQVSFMRLIAGTNPMTLSNAGTPNCTLEVRYYDAWL